jgi:hypothetical protein
MCKVLRHQVCSLLMTSLPTSGEVFATYPHKRS